MKVNENDKKDIVNKISKSLQRFINIYLTKIFYKPFNPEN